jgi:menaquinone-dependent protoporphyrinogen oxidase
MKTLVIYGSRRGTTKYCADLIGKTLGEESFIIDVNSRDIRSYLESYEQIIIGANAFNFKLNRNVRSFIKRNLNIILEKRVYLYICCGAEEEKDTLSLYENSYPSELLKKAESMDNFGGCLDSSNESWLIRRILKRMKVNDYDTMDENTVIQWTSKLEKKLNVVLND